MARDERRTRARRGTPTWARVIGLLLGFLMLMWTWNLATAFGWLPTLTGFALSMMVVYGSLHPGTRD